MDVETLFFERSKRYSIVAKDIGSGVKQRFTIEELYQAFKKRLRAEENDLIPSEEDTNAKEH